MALPSHMKHSFSQVPRADIPRSSFDRPHGYKTTMNAGWLVPCFVDEALPGDTFSLRMTAFGRLATPLHPIMDNMRVETFFFAVPMRLLWDNWERFMGAQDDPGDSIDYTIPQMVAPAGGYNPNHATPANALAGQLSDYFGIPTLIAGLTHSSMWHRAYNLIYNEWFRDQNMQNSVVVDTDDGPDTYTDYQLLRRGKRHDYFTSALPWPQKGDAVDLPLGTTAPVLGIGLSNTPLATDESSVTIRSIGGETNVFATGWSPSTNTNQGLHVEEDPDNSGYPRIRADLSDATAATLNDLRESVQIQRLLERDARGGTRYTELVQSHFGVTSPDARLQRPEYLGGGSSPINVSPIAQTSETSGTSPQGNLAAMGVAHMNGHGFTKSFTEHCVIVGLVNIRADLSYQQGLDRMFSRLTRYDFYWPAFAHLGEQEVLNKEIYADGSANDDLVFGYQERYAEYRYKPSKITGKFRSNDPATLDTWHLAQEFGSLPTLDDAFIEDDPPIDRIIAVANEPHFLLDMYGQLRCARPMPMFGVPGMMDHF